ncbi:MAG: IS66 family transposase [Thermoleophilia bacterium]|nr:IS66 family transposase [Thermoleophilia bacterium]
MERAEAEAVYDAGREACVEFLIELTARYERQVTRLEARIERLEEKLRESSQNSSQPPSADPPAKRSGPERSPSPRKQGGQPGHEGKTRKLVAEDQLDRVIDHWPASCSGCGADLDSGEHEPAGNPHRHQITELPAIAVTVTEHRAHALRCPGCGHATRATLPEGIGASAFGPRLAAAIALLSVRNRISRRDASELCGELFGAQVSTGSVDAICQRASTALASPYAELREAVKDAPVLSVDETGWRCAGQKRTLCGAITDTRAAFHIAADRHERELPELIGEGFAGIVSSDRWWAYDSLDPARRQVCWAHLLRDFRRHSEGLAGQGRFGEEGLAICRELFGAWDRFAEHADRERLAREIAPIKRRLRALLEPHRKKTARNRRFRTFARNLLKLWPALWTFTEVEGVEPTNNRAERGLRSAVIYRKISLGSQSEAGERFAERMLSVSQTCRLQGRSLFGFLIEAITASARASPAPSLV